MQKDAITSEMEEEEVERDQYLVFTVKGQEFGIQAMRVQEISRVLEVTEVPNSPGYIEGIMNLRGKLASVINFRKRFGFAHKEFDEDTRFIVVEHNNFPIGIIVDAVEEVIKIPDGAVQKLPETASTLVKEEYIIGVGMMQKRMVILLDIDMLLGKTHILDPGIMDKAINAMNALNSE
jgi:purine-binding chemotaxis protein CheW